MIWALRLLGFGKTLLSWGRGAWKWLAVIAACSALSWLHGCNYGTDRTHQKYASQALESANKARSASEGATASKDKRDDEFQAQQKELEDAAKTGSNEPVGTGVRNVLDGMRKQQAAGDKTAR